MDNEYFVNDEDGPFSISAVREARERIQAGIRSWGVKAMGISTFDDQRPWPPKHVRVNNLMIEALMILPTLLTSNTSASHDAQVDMKTSTLLQLFCISVDASSLRVRKTDLSMLRAYRDTAACAAEPDARPLVNSIIANLESFLELSDSSPLMERISNYCDEVDLEFGVHQKLSTSLDSDQVDFLSMPMDYVVMDPWNQYFSGTTGLPRELEKEFLKLLLQRSDSSMCLGTDQLIEEMITAWEGAMMDDHSPSIITQEQLHEQIVSLRAYLEGALKPENIIKPSGRRFVAYVQLITGVEDIFLICPSTHLPDATTRFRLSGEVYPLGHNEQYHSSPDGTVGTPRSHLVEFKALSPEDVRTENVPEGVLGINLMVMTRDGWLITSEGRMAGGEVSHRTLCPLISRDLDYEMFREWWEPDDHQRDSDEKIHLLTPSNFNADVLLSEALETSHSWSRDIPRTDHSGLPSYNTELTCRMESDDEEPPIEAEVEFLGLTTDQLNEEKPQAFFLVILPHPWSDITLKDGCPGIRSYNLSPLDDDVFDVDSIKRELTKLAADLETDDNADEMLRAGACLMYRHFAELSLDKDPEADDSIPERLVAPVLSHGQRRTASR